MNKYAETSVFDIFKSRRFITAIATVIVLFVIGLIPGLEPYRDAMIQGVVIVAVVVILGYSGEDIVRELRSARALVEGIDLALVKAGDEAAETEDPTDDLIVDIVEAVIAGLKDAGVLWRPDVPLPPGESGPIPEQPELKPAEG